MKSIAMVLALAISGIAITATCTSAYANAKMTGKGHSCSSGMNCMSDRYHAATKKKGAAAQTKTGN